MADRSRPALYTIPAHRAFADALAIGILAQHGGDLMALARGTILVPNRRAARTISEAFIRHSDRGGGKGLLLPRLVPVGDPELDERLGVALDPMDADAAIPPAIGAMERQMILARLVQEARADAGQPVDAGEAIRLALALASTLDQMMVEQVPPAALRDLPVREELSGHWQRSLAMFELLLSRWPAELSKRGLIDLADRRNRLLTGLARRWRATPPTGFVIAAGISTTAPAIASLLKTVAFLPKGQVVLADLDLNLTEEEWRAIGPSDPDLLSGRQWKHETHPQFALKLLLDRMDMGREEVRRWKWGSEHDARVQRSRNISNALLVPHLTGKWRDLKAGDRSLAGVRALEAANPAEEAQAVAIALREALETPGRTAALVTPDRQFAARVSGHLRRWGIQADDSAGQPLSQLPPGTLLLALADAAAERFAPVALLTLLKHPLVMQGDQRLAWLGHVRELDLVLRGPRPAPGLDAISDRLAGQPVLAAWWQDVQAMLAPLEATYATDRVAIADLLAALREAASRISHDAIWSGHQGHQAADLFAEMEAAAPLGPRETDPRGMSAMLEQVLAAKAVRPPQGGHPRIAILGLIEARLQQADLMILSGLNEGSWPPLPSPDPWLAPRIRQELGLPGLERRIGLAAHDLANGLGAPDVLITRSRRDASAPAVASRFWLRMQAMAAQHWRIADDMIALARGMDRPDAPRIPYMRPAPNPAPEHRPDRISVTEVDRLQADPYAFYARRILRLSRLDPVDAEPSAAWRGTVVHDILDRWAREGAKDPARLIEYAQALLDDSQAHPLMRTLWQPRLLAALAWVVETIRSDQQDAGRALWLTEAKGSALVAGVTLTGTADRIDRLHDGTVAIVDYKTGKPPSAKQVAAGYSMQLGLLGMIAQQGGFEGMDGQGMTAALFEYWSLQKRPNESAFGYRASPVDAEGSRGKLKTADLVGHAQRVFADAAGKWLTGRYPFTAKLVPDLAIYDEYDQLMRLEEWYGRGDGDG